MSGFGPIGLVLRGRLRRRWQAWLLLSLVAAVGFTLAISSVVIARRTDSSYERVRDRHDAMDVAASHNLPPAEAEAQLRGMDLDGVDEVRHWAGFIPAGSADLPPEWRIDILGPLGSDVGLERPAVVAGRLPDPVAVNEVAVDERTAEIGALEVGDQLQLSLFHSDFSAQRDVTFEVVGVARLAISAVADDTFAVGAVFTSRTFVESNGELIGWSATGLNLASDDDRRAFITPLFEQLGWPVSLVADESIERVSSAVRPVVLSLVLVGTLAFFATGVILFLALAREQELWRDEADTLTTLGLTGRGHQVLAAAMAGLVLGAALLAALIASYLLSALAPVGSLRDYETAPGFHADPMVWGPATVLVVGVGATFVAVEGHRQATDRSDAPRAPGPMGPLPVSAGLARQFLATSVGEVRRRPLVTLLLGSLATAAVSMVLVFVASLERLADTSDLYGQTADVVARNAFGDQDPADVRELVSDPTVVGATSLTETGLLVGDLSAPGYAVAHVGDAPGLRLVDGDNVGDRNEVLRGAHTLDRLGLELGDRVEIRRPPSNTGRDGRIDRAQVTVVGTVVFPPLGSPGQEVARLADGVAISSALHREFHGQSNLPEMTLIDLAPGQDPDDWIARNGRQIRDQSATPTEWFATTRPAALIESAQVDRYLVAGSVVLAVVVGLVLAGGIGAILRRQRADLGVLHALGMPTRRLWTIAGLQALAVTSAVLVVGVPVGVAVGRVAWVRFAEDLGVAPLASGASPPLVLSLVGLVVAALGGTALGVRSQLSAPEMAVREHT